MSKATHGQPQGISHHMASFRLRELATDLKKDPVYGSSGKNARTLVKDSDLSLVLTTVRKDAVIHEHKAPANAALLLIDGEILFTGSGTGETTIVEPSQTLVFPGDFPHSLEARKDSTFLLVIGVRHQVANSRVSEPRPS